MIQGAKGGVNSWTRDDWSKMTIIMGDKIPRIGHMALAHRDIFEASPENVAFPITMTRPRHGTVE